VYSFKRMAESVLIHSHGVRKILRDAPSGSTDCAAIPLLMSHSTLVALNISKDPTLSLFGQHSIPFKFLF
jgi:hypothetical protein